MNEANEFYFDYNIAALFPKGKGNGKAYNVKEFVLFESYKIQCAHLYLNWRDTHTIHITDYTHTHTDRVRVKAIAELCFRLEFHTSFFLVFLFTTMEHISFVRSFVSCICGTAFIHCVVFGSAKSFAATAKSKINYICVLWHLVHVYTVQCMKKECFFSCSFHFDFLFSFSFARHNFAAAHFIEYVCMRAYVYDCVYSEAVNANG